MQGLKIGHTTQEKYGTGVSVFILDKPATAAYILCGSSPATHEFGPLEASATVTHIDGLVLCGGSAFGLSATAGAMRWFQEQKRGWATPYGAVPILPAAAIFDLGVKSTVPPSPDDAYQACLTAVENNTASGRIGAGTGASVGKIVKSAATMSGGIGYAEVHLPHDIKVIAYAVVNSVGDVRDKEGKIIAGAKSADGAFADCQKYLLSGHSEEKNLEMNTTLVAIFTNAKFAKTELHRIAKMAVAGMGRAITPIFTQYDGDIIFCVSLGEKRAVELIVGTAAAEATQQAIINAVINSVVLQ